MEKNDDIFFEELAGNHGNIGLITLTRPKALNALNHEMILAFDHQLTQLPTINSI